MPQFTVTRDGVDYQAEEDVSLRSRDGKVGTLPNGDRVIQLQPGTHYWDRDARAYLDCDNTIQPDATIPGFTHNSKGIARARLATGGKFRFGLRHPLYVTYSPRGAHATAPTVAGNKAQYKGLWPKTDVDIVKFPEGVKETLILADASAPSSYVWDLEEIAGVVPTPSADGGLDYVETLTGAIVGRIPAPTVHDAAGVPGPVALTYSAGAVTIAVDPAWLADPARVWPVTLDPTTVIQPDPTAGIDTYVAQVTATSNYGTDTKLGIGDGASAGTSLRSLLKPDISSIPADTTVVTAQLELYNNATGNATALPNAALYRATATWDEATATWNLQPTFDAAAIFTVSSIANTAGWVAWTGLETLVQNWLTATWANNGVVLKKTTEVSAAGDNKYFYSSDYTTDVTLRPKWTIVHTHPPSATPTSPTGTTAVPGVVPDEVTPRLSWTYSDPDSEPQVQYQARVYDTANNLIHDSGEVTSANAYYDVPLTAGLKYGITYGWQVRATDGTAWGNYSALTYFQCVMSAPTGLTATADAANAKINLSWTAHTGENLAGYRVYRRKAGGSTWTKFNQALAAANSYTDDAAVSGQGYDYAVSAVATDGYESPLSAAATGSVTYAGTWIDDVKLTAPALTDQTVPFLGSVVPVHGKTAPVVFGRQTARRRTLVGTADGSQAMAELELALIAGKTHRYADPAQAFRFMVVGDLRAQRTYPVTDASGNTMEQFDWSIDVVEVA